jgi:hypothetical protein
VNTLRRNAIAVAVGLACSAAAFAQSMSKEQYQSAKDVIAADFKSNNTACGSLAGNAKDICKAQAGGEQKFARAELEAKYKPSVDASYKVRLARADANYAVAKEECDDKAGNVKEVCVKEAKAVSVAAKADAKAQMKSTNASNVASEKGADARKDAAADKRAADYAVAREKCDVFAGEVKANCLGNAKARFGKS